jgi:predicted amino acid dehydrogenase
MKEIIKIAYGPSSENYDAHFSFQNEDYRLKRLGVDANVDLALHLLKTYRHECDVFAVAGFPPILKIGRETIIHPVYQQLRVAAGRTPVADGTQLRKTSFLWALKSLLKREPHLLSQKKIGFFCGIFQADFLHFFEEHTSHLVFADLYFSLGIPKLMHSSRQLAKSMGRLTPALMKVSLGKKFTKDYDSLIFRTPLMREFHRCDVYIIHKSQLDYVKLWPLEGKTVIVDSLDRFTKDKLLAAGAGRIISCFPEFPAHPEIGCAALEALFLSHQPDHVLDDETLLQEVRALDAQPTIIETATKKKTAQFAFVIHPLTQKQLFQVPGIKNFQKLPLARGIEKMMGKVPGFYYCKMNGIKSEFNGQEVQGELYVIPATPKQLLRQDPESIYRRIHQLCLLAHHRGTSIIGLGAYTKIVGDAGVTIANRSPIPVTTGNSLSAAATLWAASYGLERMDLVKRAADGRYQGTAMVIGATGSIGKVCARHLCQQWEKVILVAPRPYKVLDLVDEMRAHCPNTEIIGTTHPDKYSPDCDLIITSTSAQGEKVMDIAQVKAGAVICDVSRPFDLNLDEVATRPDVLVIASGEVELPGQVKIGKTLNLEGGAVYACLAETALLAMEGRFENYSLSRDLDYDKVIEIDQLARKHGIRLSAIMGHTGEITDPEIALCREHALRARPS